MKTLKLIALAAFALLFVCCKATQPTAPASGSGPSLVEVVQILDSVQAKFYDIAQANLSNTPGQDMLLLASWLQSQPTVKSVGAYDSTDLDIELKSGLHTIFSSYSLGSDSLATVRGGGNPAQGLKLSPNIQSENTIINKKILIYTPYVASQNNCQYCLYHQEDMDALQKLLSRAGSDFIVTINYGTSLNDLQTFGDYGLVFIDTHGLPDGFYTSIYFHEPSLMDSSGHTVPISEDQLLKFIDQDFGSGTAELLKNGSLLLAGWSNEGSASNWQQYLKRIDNGYRIVVGGKYISGLPAMPNTIIVGNFCYSGWQINGITNALAKYPITINNPIQPAFASKQLISYYSYGYANGTAGAVGDKFALAMEDSLITKLVLGSDSTGSAYTDQSGNMFVDRNYRNDLFQHSGADNYSYDSCGSSFTDDRDGQIYKTVCIGTQKWMAQNLNYNAPGSHCYSDDPANCAIYGRLYDWNTIMAGAASSTATPSGVQGICPKGWHVPSYHEYTILWDVFGIDTIAGASLKATNLWAGYTHGTNSSGFSALPAGDIESGTLGFGFLGTGTWFWTTTASASNPSNAYSRQLIDINNSFPIIDDLKVKAFSCRCLKD